MRYLSRCLFICLICGLLAGGPLDRSANAQATALASLDAISGLVQHQTADADPQNPAAWQTITAPILVSEGDRIRTDAAGLAYLTFFEGIQTEIRANSLVVISTLDLASEDAVNISLDVLVGTTYTAINSALEPHSRFEIHTPGATAAVRGTEWWTFVEPNGDATFATESGRVDIFLHRAMLAAPEANADAGTLGAEAPAAAAAPAAVAPAVAAFVEAGGFVGVSQDGSRLATPRTITLPDRDQLPIRNVVPASCGDGICTPVERRLCAVDCVDRATLTACGDGICDPAAGESLILCGADCGPFAGAQCGNAVCDADESGLTCPSDCAADQFFSPVNAALCGNGTCDPTESGLTCPTDC